MPIPRRSFKRILHRVLPRAVRRRSQTYLATQGWQRVGSLYEGYYRTRFGSFKGEIDPQGEEKLRYFIFEPPQVQRDFHWTCFTKVAGVENAEWYAIHLLPFPNDLDSGILAIERTITDAFIYHRQTQTAA